MYQNSEFAVFPSIIIGFVIEFAIKQYKNDFFYHIVLIFCCFIIRGTMKERIYRESRGPPVCSCVCVCVCVI